MRACIFRATQKSSPLSIELPTICRERAMESVTEVECKIVSTTKGQNSRACSRCGCATKWSGHFVGVGGATRDRSSTNPPAAGAPTTNVFSSSPTVEGNATPLRSSNSCWITSRLFDHMINILKNPCARMRIGKLNANRFVESLKFHHPQNWFYQFPKSTHAIGQEVEKN